MKAIARPFVQVLTLVILLVGIKLAIAHPLQVRIERWIEVQQISGTVLFQRGQQTQAAQVGTRLQQIGDQIRTGARSSALLAVDTNIGTIAISPHTALAITELRALPSGGTITRLQVTQGQARLQVRPLLIPGSNLEIQTPAGSSAVRGTEFGVLVQPNGITGVATLEGNVIAQAQGQSVTLSAGLQTIVVPGEPPAPPTALTDRPSLRLEVLTELDQQTARIVGQTEPINLLAIADAPQSLDRDGKFAIEVPLPLNRQIEVVVTTPSGRQQVYALAVPSRN